MGGGGHIGRQNRDGFSWLRKRVLGMCCRKSRAPPKSVAVSRSFANHQRLDDIDEIEGGGGHRGGTNQNMASHQSVELQTVELPEIRTQMVSGASVESVNLV